MLDIGKREVDIVLIFLLPSQRYLNEKKKSQEHEKTRTSREKTFYSMIADWSKISWLLADAAKHLKSPFNPR